MQICELLPEKWEYFNGNYEGRDLNLLPMYFDIFKIDNKVDMLILISKINQKSIEIVNKRNKSNGKARNNIKAIN